jgi:hypothetical protein
MVDDARGGATCAAKMSGTAASNHSEKRGTTPSISFCWEAVRQCQHVVAKLADISLLIRRFSELAVFDARLYIRIRRIDQPAQGCDV